MVSLFFRKDQNEFFDKQEQENREEVFIWALINVVVPSVIVFIPAALYSFLPEERVNYQDLILNGSFSLLGISILFSMSVLLINSMRLKDAKLEKQILELRTRLLAYLCVLILFGTIIYVLQIAFVISTRSQTVFVTVSFIVLLVLSIGVGKRIYLLKDDLVGRSYNEDIQDAVSHLRSSTHGI